MRWDTPFLGRNRNKGVTGKAFTTRTQEYLGNARVEKRVCCDPTWQVVTRAFRQQLSHGITDPKLELNGVLVPSQLPRPSLGSKPSQCSVDVDISVSCHRVSHQTRRHAPRVLLRARQTVRYATKDGHRCGKGRGVVAVRSNGLHMSGLRWRGMLLLWSLRERCWQTKCSS